jgi:hypothetical protein
MAASAEESRLALASDLKRQLELAFGQANGLALGVLPMHLTEEEAAVSD